MELNLIYYACLALCVIGFLQVLSTVKTNMALKIYLLVIIASLFVMNLFSFADITSRSELIIVKTMRTIYVGSTMLMTVKMIKSTVPKWMNVFALSAMVFIIGIRILF